MAQPAASESTGRPTWHRWSSILFAALLVVSVVGMALLALAVARPGWWGRAILTGSAAEHANLAVRLENGLVTTLAETAADGSAMTLGLSAAEANAWLEHRFPKWLENRGENWALAGAPRVAFDDGFIRLGAPLAKDQRRILSLRFHCQAAGGMLEISETSWAIGRLPIRPEWAAAYFNAPELNGRLAEVGITLRQALSGESVALPAQFSLGDGRMIEVLGIRPTGGRLEVTCRVMSAK